LTPDGPLIAAKLSANFPIELLPVRIETPLASDAAGAARQRFEFIPMN
jgi:hypothetical protein